MKRLLVACASLVMVMTAFVMPHTALAAIDTTPDCDTVAIIRCGFGSETELRNKTKQGDVQAVYNNFGISQGSLNGFVDGVVWKDGRVTLGSNGQGRVVATNAMTAGRWDHPTSDMTRIPNTDRAYRMSTSHFTDEGQVAVIKMVNNKFAFAVIKTCGNPVTGHPTTPPTPSTPGLTVEKKVSQQQTQNWQELVMVKPGDHVKFRIVAKNTGNVTLDKLSFQDVMPAGLSQVQTMGSLTLDGHVITNAVTDGFTLNALKPGQQHIIIFEAATASSENRQSACSTGLINKGIIRSGNVLPDKSDTAAVKVCQPTIPQPPKPNYVCTSLTVTAQSNRTVTVTGFSTKTANGAVYKRAVIDWGDGTNAAKTTDVIGSTHQYSSDGTKLIKATAYFTVNGKEVSSTNTACSQQVTFTANQPPVVTTPEQPGKLVDTGPGAIVGTVLSVVTGGSVAYKYVWLRRFGL